MHLTHALSTARPILHRMMHTHKTVGTQNLKLAATGGHTHVENTSEGILKVAKAFLHALVIPHVTLGYMFSQTSQKLVGTERYLKHLNTEETPDKTAFALYRAITQEELDRLIENPNRPLFSDSTKSADPVQPLGGFLHIVGTEAYDQSRSYTSFSTEQFSALKFAYQSPAYGVVAKFHIPKALVIDQSKPGSGTYSEVLIPTPSLKLSMVEEIEIRTGKELAFGKRREMMAESPVTFGLSHYFDTPPMAVFKMPGTTPRSQIKILLNEMTVDHEIEEAHEAARIEEPSVFVKMARHLNAMLLTAPSATTDY